MTPTDDLTPEQLLEATAPDTEQMQRETDEKESQEIKATEGFAEVEKLIRVSKARTKAISFEAAGEKIEIRILSGIRISLRKKIQRFFKGLEDGETDVDASAGAQADLMASLCLDAPWTDPKAWLYIDKMTGTTGKAFGEAFRQILEIDEATLKKLEGR